MTRKEIMKKAWELYKNLNGDHKAKLAMAMRMAWQIAKATSDKLLVALTGSEKQIAWANDIRKTAIINYCCHKFDTTGKLPNNFFTVVNHYAKASIWIEYRQLICQNLSDAMRALAARPSLIADCK